MRKSSLLLVVLFIVGLSAAVFAEPYDKAATVAAMRANVARIGAIKKAVAAEDFFSAGKAFFDYGVEAAAMRKMDPPKGSQEEWTKIWAAFQDKAFVGVGACGERDAAKALKTLDELVALNKVGHPAFR
ncbi:MAG: hypothetical protein WCT14_05160 [Treponemataceae bacterium]